ncbi:MAG: class I SAM-dependent methyltransferase [Chloroflexota bacterium]
MKNHSQVVEEQIQYYRDRASEYDEWFLRQGRYDRGDAHAKQWFAEVTAVQSALAHFAPTGKVLELASGTGWWTEQLNQYADAITAVDSAQETIAINKAKLNSPKISYQQANIFEWQPAEKFDVVFFSFWLSHVPPERFESFWQMVATALGENGRVFIVDSLYTPDSTAKNQFLKTEADTTVTRHLNNGNTYEIVKLFYTPELLRQRLEPLGWRCQFDATKNFFIFGGCQRIS